MRWLADIGNQDLAKKLDFTGDTDLLIRLEVMKEGRRKRGATLRQKKHRLKDKGIAPAQDEIVSAESLRLAWEATEKRMARISRQKSVTLSL